MAGQLHPAAGRVPRPAPAHFLAAIVLLRAQATRDAQTSIAADWVWEEKTVVQWDGDLSAIDLKKVATSDLEADSLTKRSTYDNTIDLLHDRTVEGLGMARVVGLTGEAHSATFPFTLAVAGACLTI